MRAFQSAVLLLFCFSVLAVAEDMPPEKCTDSPLHGLLDFSVGGWNVYSATTKVGENKIEKILGDCAVMEHWMGAVYVRADYGN